MNEQATKEHIADLDLDAMSPTEAIDTLLRLARVLKAKMDAAKSYIPPMIDYLCGECGEVFPIEDRVGTRSRIPTKTEAGWDFGPINYSCPHCGSLDIAEAPDGE